MITTEPITLTPAQRDRLRALLRAQTEPPPPETGVIKLWVGIGIGNLLLLVASLIVGPTNPPDWLIACILIPLLIGVVVWLALTLFAIPAAWSAIRSAPARRAAAANPITLPDRVRGQRLTATAAEAWNIEFDEDDPYALLIRDTDGEYLLIQGDDFDQLPKIQGERFETLPARVSVTVANDHPWVLDIAAEGDRLQVGFVSMWSITGRDEWGEPGVRTIPDGELPTELARELTRENNGESA